MSEQMKVTYPISIGLVGGPGSGKTELGNLFYELASDYFEKNDSELWVVENAGKTIEQDFDYAMGMVGDFTDDLRACFRRFEAEQMARAKGVSFISLGTIVENIAHTGINLEGIMTGIQTPDQEMKVQRWQVTMTMLTFLLQSGHFRYNFGFYLPYAGSSLVVPGADVETDYEKRIDQGIKMVFANFGLRIQVLDEPTMEEKAEVMFSTIREIMENGVPVPAGVAAENESPTSEEPTLTEDAELPQ